MGYHIFLLVLVCVLLEWSMSTLSGQGTSAEARRPPRLEDGWPPPAVDDRAIPPAAQSDTRFAKGFLVCTHYSGALAVSPNDSSNDDAPGINQCMIDAATAQLTAYLPCGTYHIADTIVAYEWVVYNASTDAPGPSPVVNHILRGAHNCGAGVRPIIKLKTTAPLFDFPTASGAARPMYAVRSFQPISVSANAACGPAAVPGTLPSHPLADPTCYKDAPAFGYNAGVEGVDFDTSGHDAAIGVVNHMSQGALTHNVKVIATGSYAAFYNLSGTSAASVNLEGVGGQYCAIWGTYGAILPLQPVVGAAVFGLTCSGQTVSAIRDNGNVPGVIAGFNITKSSNGAAVDLSAHASVLLDGKITMSGSAADDFAINNRDSSNLGRNLYLRNIYVTGTPNLIRSGSKVESKSAGTWRRIIEYVYTDQYSYDPVANPPATYPNYPSTAGRFESRSLIGLGTTVAELSQAETPITNIVEGATVPPADLLSRHVWTAFPGFDDGGTCINLLDPPYNATAYPGYYFDDVITEAGTEASASTTKLNTAIADAETAGHNCVLLPRGMLLLDGPITLRANTKLIGAGPQKSVIGYKTNWNPTSAVPMIQTVNNASGAAILGMLTITQKTTPRANDWMSPIHWRVGKQSMIANVHLHFQYNQLCTASSNQPNNPRTLVQFSGGGGGRHYTIHSPALFAGERNAASLYFHMNGNTQPVTIYGANMEFGKGKGACPRALTNVKIENNSAGVRLYGHKKEGQAAAVVVHNSSNVGHFGIGTMNLPSVGEGAHIHVTGTSTDVVLGIAQAMHDTDTTLHVIRDHVTGITEKYAAQVPTGVTYYRRGNNPDDTPFTTTGASEDIPTHVSAVVNSATQITHCWNVQGSADMLPASGASGYTVQINGGSAIGPSGTVTRSGQKCFVLPFPAATFAAGQTITLSYALGNITAGTGTPAATVTNAAVTNDLTAAAVQTQTTCAVRSIHGTETVESSPWYAGESGGIEGIDAGFPASAQFRVRCKIVNTVATAQPKEFYPCYERGESGTYAPLAATCTALDACYADAPDMGLLETTSQQLTPVQATFVPGVYLEQSVTNTPITLSANSETEIEFAAQIPVTAAGSSRHRFRICTAGGVPLNGGHTYTQLVVVASQRSSLRGGGTLQ